MKDVRDNLDQSMGINTNDSDIPPPGSEIGNTLSKVNRDPGYPQFYTLTQLMDIEFNVSPVVEGLLYKSNISVVGAKPKVGKSTLLRFLSKCLVDNESFLGRDVVLGKVLYLAVEEPPYNVQRDFTAMGTGNTDNVFVASLSEEPNKFHATECLIDLLKPSLVVVDTMVHIVGIKDMNDYSQTTVALKRMRDLAEKYDCHILLVHHARKGEFQGNDSILGSTGISGAVDLIIQMEMDVNGRRFLSTNGRSGEHFDRTPLDFESSKKHFHIASNYTPVLYELVKETIAQYPGIGRSEIQSKLEKRADSITRTLRELDENGEIENRGEGRKSSYFLVDSENYGGEE